MLKRISSFAILASFSACPLRAAETIDSTELGFRIMIPDGFAREPSQARGDILFVFHRLSSNGHRVGQDIMIERLNGEVKADD